GPRRLRLHVPVRVLVTPPDRVLDFAYREVFADGPAGQLLLESSVRGAEEGAGMSHSQRPLLQVPLARRRQLQEPERVRDRRSALADPARDLVMGEREVLDQLLVRGGFLERIELLALHVLDD